MFKLKADQTMYKTSCLALFIASLPVSVFAETKGDVICAYAPSQSKAVIAVAGSAGGAGVATAAIGQALGLSVVTHSSGAFILSGSGGYIAGTLGAAVTAPAIIAVAVVVGGTAATVELVCAPRNHPGYVAKVEAAAVEARRRWDEKISVAMGSTNETIERISAQFEDVTLGHRTVVPRRQQHVFAALALVRSNDADVGYVFEPEVINHAQRHGGDFDH